MGVFGTKVGVPGVQVRIEVQQRHRSTGTLGGGAQQRQGDGVVPTDGDQRGPVLGQFQGVVFNGFDGLVDVERVHRHIPGVGDLAQRERGDVHGRVVGADQAGGLAYVGGAEAGTGTVGDPGVERDAHDLDVRLFNLVQARQPGVGSGTGVARDQCGIDGSELAVFLDTDFFHGWSFRR